MLMIKDLRNFFYSDARVIITEGDIVNPTVVFEGTIYEVPSILNYRFLEPVRVYNNTLHIHLIRG